MTIISNHAKERLIQRRKVKHIERHINKINSWNLPDEGVTIHKGWAYITRGGVLVTVHGTDCLKQIKEGSEKK